MLRGGIVLCGTGLGGFVKRHTRTACQKHAGGNKTQGATSNSDLRELHDAFVSEKSV